MQYIAILIFDPSLSSAKPALPCHVSSMKQKQNMEIKAMQNIITRTMHRAASHDKLVSFYLIQTGAFDLPYGDAGAMAKAAQDEGLTVTQSDNERFIINNTAWMTKHGVIRALDTSNL